MSTRVNSLPPPWPNQALAQAREASKIPTDQGQPKPAKEESFEVRKAKAATVEESTNQSSPHDQKSAGEQAVTGHVNIEA